MRVIIQRVKEANVKVFEKVVGKISYGYMILVGFTSTDNNETITKMVQKITNLRIMDDDNGVMNRNIVDVKGEILSISQFTLYANTNKGNRPSYVEALEGSKAIILYDEFNRQLRNYVKVEAGIFGADMQVGLVNDGPITIVLER